MSTERAHTVLNLAPLKYFGLILGYGVAIIIEQSLSKAQFEILAASMAVAPVKSSEIAYCCFNIMPVSDGYPWRVSRQLGSGFE